ncbi:putative isoprenoid biosynthesis-related protein [Armillaria novae-zelandiae]|uniref:Isoprenoid biosynthesis-related protein n=1 Tax=Armillaria novae-zelandiae TaxID=153914 RepID=A0AA39NSL7_9AGAR|nr:putative isoprenoid biosynthesis-related protein [Armillaria novae-zelandiae]
MSTDKVARRASFEGARKVINMSKDMIEWYEKGDGGKLNCSMSVVDTAEIIKKPPLIDGEYLEAAVLGWGIEVLLAFFLVSDATTDSSITRLGLHFRGESYYVGYSGALWIRRSRRCLSSLYEQAFTKKRSLIMVYKTAYSFHLPVTLAVYMFHHVNTALVACMPEQRRVLDENLERKDSECERRILEVFEGPEVDLRMADGVYEERVYRELVVMIGEILEVKGKSILKGEMFTTGERQYRLGLPS